MMIIHILVDTSHVESQDENVVDELEYFQDQTTNTSTFTSSQ